MGKADSSHVDIAYLVDGKRSADRSISGSCSAWNEQPRIGKNWSKYEIAGKKEWDVICVRVGSTLNKGYSACVA